MNTKPVWMRAEDYGELLVVFDPRGEVGEVRRAEPGLLPPNASVVWPGDSLHGVPYEAWLAHLDQSVRLRDLQAASAREQQAAGRGTPPRDEEDVPGTRSGKSFWTTELGPKAMLVFFLTYFLAQFPEWYREAFESGQGAVFFVIACIAALGGVIRLIFDVEFPRWLKLLLIAGLVGVVLTDFLSL